MNRSSRKRRRGRQAKSASQKKEDHDESDSDDGTEKRRLHSTDLSYEDFVIRRTGASVMFFSDISTKSVGRLIQLLRQACKFVLDGRAGKIEDFKDGCVELEIASEGGCSFSGLLLHDLVVQLPLPIRGIVCGQCCSAATMLLLACHERCMLPHSFLLLHDISYGVEGSRKEIEREVINTRMISNQYRAIYLARSSLTPELLDAEMSHDGILDTTEALHHRLVDRVVGPDRSKWRTTISHQAVAETSSFKM